MARLDETAAGFEATRWTLLGALQSSDALQRSRAAEALASRYWPPVYAWLRRAGHRREEAAEITQAFFTDVVVGRRLFERASEERGRLRTLLLTALQNYIRDCSRRRRVRPDGHAITLELATFNDSQLECGAPEDAFTRQWALAILDEALERCEAHFRRTGRAGHWSLFEARVLAPARGVATPIPYADLHASLGFKTSQDAAAAVHVVKKRFEALLHEVIAETVTGSPVDAATEHHAVIAALSL